MGSSGGKGGPRAALPAGHPAAILRDPGSSSKRKIEDGAPGEK